MNVFISYRRDDATPIAGRIHDRLRAHFGDDSVFMDVDNIPIGVDFRVYIDEILKTCEAMLVVIGDDWMGIDDVGNRRIDNPTDFVRIEVQTALARNIPVVPLLVAKAAVPSKDDLPNDINDLAFRNGVTVDPGIDFHHHMDRVINGLEASLKSGARSGSTNQTQAKPKRRSRKVSGAKASGDSRRQENQRDKPRAAGKRSNSNDQISKFAQGIRSQDDLATKLIGTTWRKVNGTEVIIFRDASRFEYQNTATSKWTSNKYTLKNKLGQMVLHWQVDGCNANCKFTDDFTRFVEGDDDRFAWSLEWMP